MLNAVGRVAPKESRHPKGSRLFAFVRHLEGGDLHLCRMDAMPASRWLKRREATRSRSRTPEWLYVYGEFPSIDLEIDHINGNPNDNRISNLRAVTHAENMHNLYRPMASNKTSGVLGVSYNGSKKSWVAQIRANGRTRVVGRFKSVSEASAAYKAAKALLHPKAGYSKMENG